MGTLFKLQQAHSPSSSLVLDIFAFIDSLYLGFFSPLFSSLECPWFIHCVLGPQPSFYINEFLFLLLFFFFNKIKINKNKKIPQDTLGDGVNN